MSNQVSHELGQTAATTELCHVGKIQALSSSSTFYLGLNRTVAIVTLLVGLAAIASFGVLAWFSRPISDDYHDFYQSRNGITDGMIWFLTNAYGRYSSAFVLAAGYRVFGQNCVQVLNAIFVAALVLALSLGVSRLLPVRNENDRALVGIAGGLMFAFASLACAPSLFDSYFWLSSSVNYVPPAATFLVAVVLATEIARNHRRSGSRIKRRLMGVALVILIGIGQGFYETLSIFVAGTCLVVLVVLIVRYRQIVEGEVLSIVATMVAWAGLAVNYFAPGAVSRRAALNTGSIHNGLHAVRIGLQSVLPNDVGFTKPLLFCLAIGIVLALWCTFPDDTFFGAVGRFWGSRLSWALGGLATAVIFGPGFVFVTGMAGSAALRTFSFPVIGVAVGLSVAIMTVVSWTLKVTLGAKRTLGFVVHWLFAAVATVSFAMATCFSAAPIYHLIIAEQMRAAVLPVRDLSVQRQLSAGLDPVTVEPAPLLWDPTNSTDFGYLPDAVSYLKYGYRLFYGFPTDVNLDVNLVQSPDYCVSWPVRARQGIQTCNQLKNP